MANRGILAKRMKMVRMKRTFPKRFQSDYVPLPMPIDRRLNAELNKHVGGYSGLEVYLKGTTNGAEAHRRAERAYMEAMYPSWFGFQNPEGRAAVFAKIAEVMEGVPIEHHVVLRLNRNEKITLHFDFKTGCAHLAYADLVLGTLKKSLKYPTREAAKVAFKHGKVLWKKPSVIASPPHTD